MLAGTSANAALIPADALRGELDPGAPTVRQLFDVFWPCNPSSRMPERDLHPRQLLPTPVNPPELARPSSGLRSLVLAKVPSQAFAAWWLARTLAVLEHREILEHGRPRIVPEPPPGYTLR